MPYVDAPVTYDFPVKWDGTNTQEVIDVISEWATVAFNDPTFGQYVSVSPDTTADNLFLTHPGANLLAIITKGEHVKLSYKKGVPRGSSPVYSVSDDQVSALYDEVPE
jgi:hypothetical protein